MKSRLSLQSGWKFRQASAKASTWLSAQVPGCVHTDLLRHKRLPDPFWGDNERRLQWIEEEDWVYRTEFSVPESLLRREYVELVFDGLDTLTIISLNGRELARTENMFIGHRFEVASYLKPKGNVLQVKFLNPMDYIRARQRPDDERESNDFVGGCSHIRKEQCSFGWDWGPRFATSGIYLPVYLEAWEGNRIESVRVIQKHSAREVALAFEPATVNAVGEFRGTVSLKGKVVARFSGLSTKIADPQLWWPNGHGAQPLYDVRLELVLNDVVVDVWEKRIGLRTIELDRHADKFGESFQFVVNGRPVFAKGANWIPAHAFVTEADRAFYDDILTSAAEANMNMLRVWGGGIYEMEDFYDLCDEKGLMVWQDFMFACALYPGSPESLAAIKAEAEYQVRRIAHRASLALWCGNNEIEQMPNAIVKTEERKKAYDDIFYGVLPDAVSRYDGTTAYWPCSPHNPEGYEKGHNNENAGDCHFWDVWHARKPVKRYEEMKFRFCSEFGMQSYSSPEVAATYCRPQDFNVFGPEMENHQKNGAGNLIILEYVSRLYRFPKAYAELAYLSQLNQAYCMKIGVEHFRRSMPRTMGALYWQINDCWPVASWSSLEFSGRWKALQYEAKRFFAPALVSVHVKGDEFIQWGNTLKSTIHDVDLYTVFDGPKNEKGTLVWSLCHLEKKAPVRRGQKAVALKYGQSVKQVSLDFAVEMKKYGAHSLYLRVELLIGRKVVSRQTVFLTAPRYLDLKPGKIASQLKKTGPAKFELTLASSVYQHAVEFHFRGVKYRADDNYFDLFPGTSRRVEIRTAKDIALPELKKRLETMSLVSSYR